MTQDDIRWITKTITNDQLVVKLHKSMSTRSNKVFFSRKSKDCSKYPVKRYGNAYHNGYVSEQEYIDNMFEQMSKRISMLSEEINILDVLIDKDYKLISITGDTCIKDKWYNCDEARGILKKCGYEYI